MQKSENCVVVKNKKVQDILNTEPVLNIINCARSMNRGDYNPGLWSVEVKVSATMLTGLKKHLPELYQGNLTMAWSHIGEQYRRYVGLISLYYVHVIDNLELQLNVEGGDDDEKATLQEKGLPPESESKV